MKEWQSCKCLVCNLFQRWNKEKFFSKQSSLSLFETGHWTFPFRFELWLGFFSGFGRPLHGHWAVCYSCWNMIQQQEKQQHYQIVPFVLNEWSRLEPQAWTVLWTSVQIYSVKIYRRSLQKKRWFVPRRRRNCHFPDWSRQKLKINFSSSNRRWYFWLTRCASERLTEMKNMVVVTLFTTYVETKWTTQKEQLQFA